jgi:hypothetical protein
VLALECEPVDPRLESGQTVLTPDNRPFSDVSTKQTFVPWQIPPGAYCFATKIWHFGSAPGAPYEPTSVTRILWISELKCSERGTITGEREDLR